MTDSADYLSGRFQMGHKAAYDPLKLFKSFC